MPCIRVRGPASLYAMYHPPITLPYLSHRAPERKHLVTQAPRDVARHIVTAPASYWRGVL
eukprot:365486-Chlamydomonas_euryale.AAC.8